MRELEDRIIFHLRDMQASGKLDELIKARLEACVASILDETLRSYGTFGRELGEQLSKALAVKLEGLGIGGYQAMVAEIIKGKINASLEGEWRAKLEASIDELLRAAPAKVTLSELLQELVNDHQDDAREHGWDRAVLTVERSSDRYCWIGLSPSGKTERWRAEWSIGVGPDGKVFSVTVAGKEQRSLLAGTLRGMERYLFQLQAGGTAIEIDLREGEHYRDYDVEY